MTSCHAHRAELDPVAIGAKAASLLSSAEYQRMREEMLIQKRAMKVNAACAGFENGAHLPDFKIKMMKAAKLHRGLVQAEKLGESMNLAAHRWDMRKPIC